MESGSTNEGPPKIGGDGADGRVRPLAPSDFAVILGLPILAAIAWLLPERWWHGAARLLVPFYLPVLPADSQSRIARFLRGHPSAGKASHAPAAIVRQVVSEDILSLVTLMRDYRPGGWRPTIELSGREHVVRALEKNRGVILWIGYFAHADLVAKMALHQAGFAVSHLSHPGHRFSSTRFGMRCLNPVQTRIEDRYLRARVLLSLDSSTAALAELRRLVGENAVVSITVRGTARRPVTVPFLSSQIDVAPGAPSLAYKSGAVLLPVFPLRNESGGFKVFVEPPIEIDRSLDRAQATAGAVQQYARSLDGYVLAYPGQWLGWFKS